MADDVLIQFARRYREEAAAALLTIIRDDNAPAHARASAAEKILGYSDGRPGQSQPIKVADLDKLSPDERNQLFRALLTYYQDDLPDLKAMVQEVVSQAQKLIQAPQRKPNPFRRGAVAGAITPPSSSVQAPPPPASPPAAAMPPESQVDVPAPPSLPPSNGRIGDIPIDQNPTQFIKANGYSNGNGHAAPGDKDMKRLLRDYQAAAQRWRTRS
jgi:hypothetical protein